MNSKTILIIDDSEEIVDIVIEEGEKMGLTIIPFEPESKGRDTLLLQLSDLCKKNKFDFALLDFELWSGFKGYNFAETLHANNIKFVAFSSSATNNEMLIKVGASFTVVKDYGSRGFKREPVIAGLKKMLEF